MPIFKVPLKEYNTPMREAIAALSPESEEFVRQVPEVIDHVVEVATALDIFAEKLRIAVQYPEEVTKVRTDTLIDLWEKITGNATGLLWVLSIARIVFGDKIKAYYTALDSISEGLLVVETILLQNYGPSARKLARSRSSGLDQVLVTMLTATNSLLELCQELIEAAPDIDTIKLSDLN